MGNFEIQQPALLGAQTSIFAFSAADISAWLDELLIILGSEAIAPWRAAEIRSRLKDTSLDAILSAIERARPGLGDSVEKTLYQQWIETNPASPLLWAAWFNIAIVLARQGNQAEAVIAYGNSLALRPDMYCAAINLGLLYEAADQPEQALATWKHALQPDEGRIALEIQRGRLLEKLGRFEEAETVLRRVLMIDSAQADVVHHWVHLRQKTCQWPVALSGIPGLSATELLQSSGPFGIMALTDDIDLQRDAAATWIARKTEPAPRRLAPAKPYPHERIRIGYMSSDFCSHAMSYLITELFERHDRNRFEVFGYCSSQDDGTELRKRVLAAFDHFRIILPLSDEEAAQVIRDDEIDILIELNGITDGSRLSVLRWRPAPIQATYLGFVGPIPLPELDYLLCDNIVIPPEHAAAYHTKPLAIAEIYQANDSKRSIGRRMSRAELGLPEDCFVLCCFSKHYKITEEMFAAWMSILRQTDKTVLWLTVDNPYSQANLIAAAKRAGIAEERIIFSERADPDLYMSRLGLADLFLDTFPYNAGTVASDAIRMQLPLVTLCGKAFASRMAASLLHAVGAPQGITTSLSKYVEIAIRLANHPAAYAQYKALFTTQAWSQTIGNIARFTTEFEDMWSGIVRSMSDAGEQSFLQTRETKMDIAMLDQRQPAATLAEPGDMTKVLHVGCGTEAREKLPALFRQTGWREIRLDIDPEVRPDFVASLTDMRVISDGLVDAVYSSHNVEHLYPHEVPLALREMRRVLKPTGFTLIKLPDLQEVARYIAEGKLDDPLYMSPMGPIAPLDILFGHRASLASGNLFMAHRTGFTSLTLGTALIEAGFAAVVVQRELSAFCLTAIAFRSRPGEEELAQAQAQMLIPDAGPAMLYTPDAPATVMPLSQASPSAPAAANFSFALLCTAQGRLQEAIDAYCHAITLQPDFIDAYINLGSVVLSLGQHEEAMALYRQAIAIRPENAMAHGNLGKALQDNGQLDEAIDMYRAAIALQPDNANVFMNYGAALLERQAWDDSVTVTRHAIELQPDSAMTHANLGTALLRLGRYEEALAACRQAMALQPRGAVIQASLGGAMLELGEPREAIALCRDAAVLDPTLPAAHFNLSHALKAMNQLEEAELAARRTIALRPEDAEYHFHLAHILLLRGDLEAGWEEYEWRWKLPDFAWISDIRGVFSQPRWTGEDIGGKAILIYTEQGLGDIIQFARYLPLVVSKAGRVIVAAHPPMHRLLETIEGITVVSMREDSLPNFDVYCPLMSLPWAFATRLDSIPASVPYLFADPGEQARWDRRIGGDRLRVGIVWAGNPAVKRDRFRSPGLASVAPLFSVPGIDFVVLQVGPGREDCDASPLPAHVLDLGREIGDLADTAAIMSGLDLMISSCTGPLHLAGALDVPSWAMIPFAPHFPWLLERTDTLWYPRMRLYRQEQPGRDWSGVVDRIAVDLAALAHSKLSRSGVKFQPRNAVPEYGDEMV
jgi:predicted O-linked N-acetylglucosamine transferase (SPINDLY family)